ncbi:MAG: flagellar biosynthetic protein FliP, partial [Paracoccaceae bacterium]
MRPRMLAAVMAAAALALMLAPQPALAQDLSLSLGQGGSLTARSVQLILLITVLSLAPGLAIMVTCFPFLVTVLSILRQAIGLQQSPPNMLIVSLAMFLTYFVMEPVFTEAWQQGVAPMVAEEIEVDEAFPKIVAPFRVFMAARLDPETYAAMAALRPDVTQLSPSPDAPLSVLV